MNWEAEEWKCAALGARTVAVPDDGTESERVPLVEVLDRKVWFPVSGLYILRNGDDAMYVGLTAAPLGSRLRSALSTGKTWTRADYTAWTVTVQRAPEYPLDKRKEWALVERMKPLYNASMGRPRKHVAHLPTDDAAGV